MQNHTFLPSWPSSAFFYHHHHLTRKVAMSQSSNRHTFYLNLDQVIIADAHLPAALTEDDILHYVLIEQAQLFPTLDQAIYFDFLVKSIEEENQKVVVVACNIKDFSDLPATILFLKIKHKDFEQLNLLPWRQRKKMLAKKREVKILTLVALSASVLMLIISFFYIYQAHQDEKRQMSLSHRKHILFSQLGELEKSNQALQVLVDRWKGRMENANYQENLEETLKMIEINRPEDILLDKISWREGRLILKGQSKEVSMIKTYIHYLAENKMDAQLKFMGASVDQAFPMQFEIEIIGPSK